MFIGSGTFYYIEIQTFRSDFSEIRCFILSHFEAVKMQFFAKFLEPDLNYILLLDKLDILPL